MYISAHFKRAALAIVDFSLPTFVYGVLIFFILLFFSCFGRKGRGVFWKFQIFGTNGTKKIRGG